MSPTDMKTAAGQLKEFLPHLQASNRAAIRTPLINSVFIGLQNLIKALEKGDLPGVMSALGGLFSAFFNGGLSGAQASVAASTPINWQKLWGLILSIATQVLPIILNNPVLNPPATPVAAPAPASVK